MISQKPQLLLIMFQLLGSHVAQLVGCWTYNSRVLGSIPTDANCFTWDNILGQDVNLVCASLHPGEIWVPSVKGYWLSALHCSNR